MTRPLDRAVGAVLLLGVVYLTLYQIGRPLWLDDTHSTHHAFEGVRGIVANLRTDSHPPLYFFFLAVWMRLAGLGEVALRLPSVVFYVLSGAVLFSYGNRRHGRTAGLLFAVFLLFNPIAIEAAHHVRMYALLGLLSSVSTVLFLQLTSRNQEPSRWMPGAYILANMLGTFTHYWFFFLMVSQGVGALAFGRGRARSRILVGLAVSAIPFALFWAPIFFEQIAGSPTSWLETPGGLWLLAIPLTLMGGSIQFDFTRPALVFYVVMFATVLVGARRWSEDGRSLLDLVRERELGLLATIPLTVMVLAYSISQVTPVFHVRYAIVVVPALAMWISLILLRFGDRRLVPLTAMFFVLGSCLLRAPFLRMDLSRDDRAAVAAVLGEHSEGDEILNVTLNLAPARHYFRALAPHREVSQTVFPAEIEEHVGWRDVEELARDTARFRLEARALGETLQRRTEVERVWLFAALQGGGDATGDSVLTSMLIDELGGGFELARTIPSRGWWHSEIRLYARRPPNDPRDPDGSDR